MNPTLVLVILVSSRYAFAFKEFSVNNFNLVPPKLADIKIDVGYIQQKLDHFDVNNKQSWLQKYYTNSRFFTAKDRNVVFLMISGEFIADARWMMAGVWSDFAQIYGALMFQLEHRYYGDSQPVGNWTTENLRYLSSKQALEDTATFIAAMNKNYNFSKDVKWIAFGGSYAGSLASWLKMKYPHLIRGAVASSGVYLATNEFNEYVEVVEKNLASHSQECLNAVRAAFKQLESLIYTPASQGLKNLFNLCYDFAVFNSELDIAFFIRHQATYFIFLSQRNPRGENVTLDSVCDIMVNTNYGNELHRLVKVSKVIMLDECLDYSYRSAVNYLSHTEVLPTENARPWFYQICTEFGWYHSSSQVHNLFGNKFPTEVIHRRCEDVFGPEFNMTFVARQMERTNTYYGGRNISVRNVVFVYGSRDPWTAVGIKESANPYSSVIYIKGATHCDDVYSASRNDPPELTEARRKIFAFIGLWLNIKFKRVGNIIVRAAKAKGNHTSPNPAVLPVVFLTIYVKFVNKL